MKKKIFTLLTLMLAVCSGAWAATETIYSMTAVTGPTGNIDSGTTVDIVATFVGGSAQAKNGKSSAAALVDGSNINLGGSSSSYFHATLTTGTIAEGDIITLSGSGTMYISETSTKGSSVTFPYTVPSGSSLIGKSDVYLWKNGVSKFSSFTITRPDENEVANPVITQTGNNVTITCGTSGASIYYTIDGTEPTANSTAYSAAFSLDNPCTVRAIAIKGENSSSIIIKDCYVTHSTALAVLGYNGGSLDSDSKVWTSTDGQFVLTNDSWTEENKRTIGYVNLVGSQDGFKLNHTDSYSLKISDNIKLTKIVVVGKSWLKGSIGNASTLAFDGFTPTSGSFFDYVDETYVSTIEFTPESELGYGATIIMRPGNNQIGAYIEIYGEEYTKTVTTYEVTSTWDFTEQMSATDIANLKADETNWKWTESSDRYANNASIAEGTTITANGSTLEKLVGLTFCAFSSADRLRINNGSYLQMNGSNFYFTIPSLKVGDKVAISYISASNKNESRSWTTPSNATRTSADGTQTINGSTETDPKTVEYTITTAGNTQFKQSAGLNIKSIVLSSASDAVAFTPAYDKSTYVTPKALDFTNVSGLKAYVATAASAGKVTLKEVEAAVPAGTPLMLIGTAGTEYTVPVAASATAPATNMFVAGDGTTTFDGTTYDYILYSDGQFYQIGSGTVATTKAYLHCESDPTAGATSRGLTISFGDEASGISQIENGAKATENAVYNLSGQRVNQPTKGLYIVNGKKVLVK